MTYATRGGPDAPTCSNRMGAVLLLVATGGVMGALFPLGKLAGLAGAAALPWALTMLLGGGGLLALAALLRGQRIPAAPRHLLYYAVAGLFSMALPNLILFMVIPRLGAGLSSVVYTLPPLLTVALAALLGIERPGGRRLAGIGLGFVGAALIVLPQGSLPDAGLSSWMLLALMVPLSLATGNIYRTLRWPARATPLALSAGTMLAGALWLALAVLATGGIGEIATIAAAPGLAMAQATLAAVQFLMFMRLQHVAGPVYVSQTGYVATAVGLAFGTLMLGESYSPWVWGAAGIIVAGIALVNAGRRPS